MAVHSGVRTHLLQQLDGHEVGRQRGRPFGHGVEQLHGRRDRLFSLQKGKEAATSAAQPVRVKDGRSLFPQEHAEVVDRTDVQPGDQLHLLVHVEAHQGHLHRVLADCTQQVGTFKQLNNLAGGGVVHGQLSAKPGKHLGPHHRRRVPNEANNACAHLQRRRGEAQHVHELAHRTVARLDMLNEPRGGPNDTVVVVSNRRLAGNLRRVGDGAKRC
mmetsp:Transcript_10094/g.32007  ORF Transcript_10094/g.32007 Transcript_10094/m.32007 type:complete len:215 (-) Transcript_10094:836-1480(-)